MGVVITYLFPKVSLHSTKYIVMGAWPSKVGGVQERLTDVDVICLISGCEGGLGGPRTVSLAEVEMLDP